MSLFIELRKQGKLAAKRNPMYEKNKFGKFWMYFMAVFWAGYLIFFGTTFAFAFDGGATEAYHVLNSGLIFVLALDFLMRFPFQKTPSQEIKPYLLLPIRRNRLIDFLLIRSGLNGFNLIWLFFFVPFAIISITKFYGITGVLTYSIGIWLLMILNNYWFLLCRYWYTELLPPAYSFRKTARYSTGPSTWEKDLSSDTCLLSSEYPQRSWHCGSSTAN